MTAPDPRSDVKISDVLAAALGDDVVMDALRSMLLSGRKPTLLVCEKPGRAK